MFLSAMLLAGGSAAAFAESYRSVAVAPSTSIRDPLFEHIQQQLTIALHAANARGAAGPGAEDVAAAATCMRVCAAHARALNIDEVARDALGRRSRTALTPTDITGLRARLRREGLIISDRLAHTVVAATPGVRASALDSIRKGRTTSVCDRLADALDLAAPRLADTEGPVRRVARTDQWWCNVLQSQWSMYLAVAWSCAAVDDGTSEAFIDSMWAGLVFYDQLHTANC